MERKLRSQGAPKPAPPATPLPQQERKLLSFHDTVARFAGLKEQFPVLVVDNMGNPKVPVEIMDAILALKPGELVHLHWNHDYVTQEGAKFSERPIRALSALTKEEAAAEAVHAAGKP